MTDDPRSRLKIPIAISRDDELNGKITDQVVVTGVRFKTVNAPWTQEQVDALNAFQRDPHFHPFTGERKPNGDETVLLATLDGWVEYEGGPVVQTWAHGFMAVAPEAK